MQIYVYRMGDQPRQIGGQLGVWLSWVFSWNQFIDRRDGADR